MLRPGLIRVIAAGANIKCNLSVRIHFFCGFFLNGILSFIFKWFCFNNVKAYLIHERELK